jgi:hypothetical protein
MAPFVSFFVGRQRPKGASDLDLKKGNSGRRCGNVGIAERFPRAGGNEGKPGFGFPSFSTARHFHSAPALASILGSSLFPAAG